MGGDELTELCYMVDVEGVRLNQRDLKNLLQIVSVFSESEIDMKTLSNPELFKKYKYVRIKLADIHEILKNVRVSKISYDGSGTFLGGE